MLEKIKVIIQSVDPKHIGSSLKKNPELLEFLLESTAHLELPVSITERAYSLLNDITSNTCNQGNKLKFKSFTIGYGFCGPAGTCKCARESVSNSVSSAKKMQSNEDKIASNLKRVETNLQKYGVSNVGQTKAARQSHSKFYSDTALVGKAVSKQRQTLLKRYGVDNAAHINGVQDRKKTTTLARYGVDNIAKLDESRSRTSIVSKNTWKKRKESNLDFDRLNQKFRMLCHTEFNIPADEYNGTAGHARYEFICNQCNSQFSTWVSCGHLPICKQCYPTLHVYKSREENEVLEYLKSLNLNVRQRDRSIISPLELDIVDDDRKIAIEYCGLYWHSEISGNKPHSYHADKMTRCNQAGYQLITIFSDDWNRKKNIAKAKLASIFDKNQQRSIGARNCTIKEIAPHDAAVFYNQHHLQGATGATMHFGLFFDNMLVAAMSFGKNRSFIKSTNDPNQHELIRYATSMHVQGGAGKLLRYYINKVSPASIISYADARWSTGKMYQSLGFMQEGTRSGPGYWYTFDYQTREHRFNYTKASLVLKGHDASLSEWEIMQNRGYDRIWDCGQLKFKMDC